jgi:hypothetical protein
VAALQSKTFTATVVFKTFRTSLAETNTRLITLSCARLLLNAQKKMVIERMQMMKFGWQEGLLTLKLKSQKASSMFSDRMIAQAYSLKSLMASIKV